MKHGPRFRVARQEELMKLNSRLLLGTVLAGTIAGAATAVWASSHREAPAIANMPAVDSTDFYMFRSYEPGREDYVTLIANYIPLQAPYGGPSYFVLDNSAIYELHIDNTGDGVEDLTFQFNFDSRLLDQVPGGPDDNLGFALNIGGQTVGIPLRQFGEVGPLVGQGALNERETYTVRMITGDRRRGRSVLLAAPGGSTTFVKPLDDIGNKTIPNYRAYADSHISNIMIPNCNLPGRVFVGQRAENFAVNLGEVFDLVNLIPLQGADSVEWPQYNVGKDAFPGGIVQDRGNDDLVDESNITSIALELPIACVTGNGNGVIGGWTSASLPQARILDPTPTFNGTSRQGGAFVQMSRLSSPLFNELLFAVADKDRYNASEPIQDRSVLKYVTNPTIPALLNILFNTPEPPTSTNPADFPFGVTDIAPSNFPRNDLVAAYLTGFPGLNQLSTVSQAEMLRLNTTIAPTPLADQHVFGVVAEDLAGFPNGRRPSDDAVDLTLRVAMGALCHPVPLGAELGIDGAVEDTPSDLVNLGLCNPEDAPVGLANFTDGAPLKPTDIINAFPYLNPPISGSPNNEPVAFGNNGG
jgi:hypothetical protein